MVFVYFITDSYVVRGIEKLYYLFMTKNRLRCNNIAVTLVIGLSFLWTGSAFLSWVYNIADLLEAQGRIASLEFLTEGVGYIFQALGILITCLVFRKIMCERKPDAAADRLLKISFASVTLADVLLTYICMTVNTLASALTFGYILNILHGVVAAMYIYMLTFYADMNRRGIIFGLGYSIGSIGSYLISLMGDSNFLTDVRAVGIYVLIAAFAVVPVFLIGYDTGSAAYSVLNDASAPGTASAYMSYETDPLINKKVAVRLLGLATAVVILLSLEKGIGFYFDFSDVWVGGMSLEYTRMYYAVGLILAGLINDLNRRWGGILCVAALVFPFMLILLNSASVSGTILWIINYAVTGFYVVYRVLLFSDIAWESLRYRPVGMAGCLVFIAPFGLMYGRIGDFISTAVGIRLSPTPIALNIFAAIFFVITIIAFWPLFIRLYLGDMTTHVMNDSHQTSANVSDGKKTESETVDQGFSVHYGLTDRETLVLFHITNKLSNKEIASELFVQESTVKYHVKNILRKTGCSNRHELCSLYEGYQK